MEESRQLLVKTGGDGKDDMKRLELLVPAGDLEKLKAAVDYGADAVYFGGEMFSLRAGAGNLSTDDMAAGIAYAHSKNVRCHLTVNIFAHNRDIDLLRGYLNRVRELEIDAFIVSDPGVMTVLKEMIPQAEIHLSTQANLTNYMAARFWQQQGVKRLVLARELTLEEISELSRRLAPEETASPGSPLELEAFVHGAMCISYSGRCLLSNYMSGRDANRGECAHPCRWQYALVEEKRPGEYFPVGEDSRGTYILNSRDLCMIEHIPAMVQAGIASLKIEGRMKSSFYVATVVGAYRKAIDAYAEDPSHYVFKQKWLDELRKVSHREFTTGFYFGRPTERDQNYRSSTYTRDYSFTGVVKSYDPATQMALVEQRNKMTIGEEIEVFGPYADYFSQRLSVMLDEEGRPVTSAPHPQQLLQIKMEQPVAENFLIRKRKEQ